MKKFNNYEEQVNSVVNGKILFNNYPKVSENFVEYLPENILNGIDEVMQWFAVSIYEENETTKQLGIFYDEYLNLYILPVTFWGVSWEYATLVNILENEEIE